MVRHSNLGDPFPCSRCGETVAYRKPGETYQWGIVIANTLNRSITVQCLACGMYNDVPLLPSTAIESAPIDPGEASWSR